MKHLLHIVIGLLLVCTAGDTAAQAPSARSLDSTKAITQYVHRAWQVDEGLPQSSVKAIAQTQDGYLWLSTEEGLARFDGVRFTVFDKTNTAAFEDGHNIRALMEDRSGNLWIGTSGSGLVRFSDGQFTAYTAEQGITGRAVDALYQDASGTLWVGTQDAGLFAYRDDRFTRYTTADGLSSDFVSALYQDQAGRLWVGTQDGLYYIKDGVITLYEHNDRLSHRFVLALYEDRQGRLWIGTRGGLDRIDDDGLEPLSVEEGWPAGGVRTLFEDRAGTLWLGLDSGGLGRLVGGRFESFTTKDGLTADRVLTIYEDREGSLWIGTELGGLNYLRDGKFTTYTTGEHLSHDLVLTVYEAADGAIWIGTHGGGLNRLLDGVVTSYTTHDGLSSDLVSSIHGDREGNLWIGTLGGGLNRLRDGSFTQYTAQDGLPSMAVFALYGGSDGSLWIGTDAGLSHFHNGYFTNYTTADGLSSDFVTAIHKDRQGDIWIGTYDAGLNRLRNGLFTPFTTDEGLASNLVLALHDDQEGALWIGTYEGGLNRLKDGVFTTYTVKDGLFNDNVYRILEDGDGNLWMSCNKGIFQVSKAALNAFAEGKAERVSSIAYGKADGLKSPEMNGGSQPAGWKGQDGRLWFPTVKGVTVIDPANIGRNTLAPPVVIEEILVDGALVDQAGLVDLAPGREKIEFHYTGLSFIASEEVRFRYILEGYDTEWQEIGTSRAATYTNLDPGPYTFRVIAQNSDGLWNETGAAVSFYLKPYFYQTFLFYALCVFALLFVAFISYQVHIQNLRARERELEALVDERTQDLRSEKEKTEQSKAVIEAQANKLQHLNEYLEEKVQEQIEVILVQRERYEQELIAEKEKVEASSQFKTAILNNMSHEFRTPLTIIQGNAEILLEEIDGEFQEFVRAITRGGKRLTDTLNALLELSWIEAETLEIDAEPVDLVQAAWQVIDRFASSAAEKNLALHLQAPANETIKAQLDPSSVGRILGHLVDNAIKFTEEGEVVVEVSRRGQQACLSVRDTGIGIDQASLPHLFEAFTQESTGLDRSFEGCGLGLTIVKRMTELMNGHISVETVKGTGTEITVYFPAWRSVHDGQRGGDRPVTEGQDGQETRGERRARPLRRGDGLVADGVAQGSGHK